MQTAVRQYNNICELYQFSHSSEFELFAKNCILLLIQVAAPIDDAGELGKIVEDIQSVFPNAQITSNFKTVETYLPRTSGKEVQLYFTFMEDVDYGRSEDGTQSLRSIGEIDKCKFSELETLYNQLKEKNLLIERYNRQITESLTYAGKLQKAVLPPKEYFNKVFPEHFVIFKPKNFVSGDFFWLFEKNNKVYFAVADCTGHGVPGALVSILGITLLNEISNILNSWNSVSASDLLNLLREMLKSSLHQTGKSEELKDGMDIALCILDKEALTLQYAGAYMPMLIAREGELIEFKGNNMPIGVYLKDNEPFNNILFQLQKDDVLYLATDGFQDQFGGPLYKKFKAKNFKNLLTSVSSRSILEQKTILKKTLELWQNGNDQIDDITVVGIKIIKDQQFNFSI